MGEWSVSIDVAAGRGVRRFPRLEARLCDLVDELGRHGGVAHGASSGRRYGARLSVEAATPAAAVEAATEVFEKAAAHAGLPPWEVVQVEVLSPEELRRQNAAPSLPELVGVGEVAEMLGVTRQRASGLARSSTFPPPLAELKAGPVWARLSVERFVAQWHRSPGRRPAAPPPLGKASISHRGARMSQPVRTMAMKPTGGN